MAAAAEISWVLQAGPRYRKSILEVQLQNHAGRGPGEQTVVEEVCPDTCCMETE